MHGQNNEDQTSALSIVRATVLNSVTKAPVARALVFAGGNQYATFADDQGRFGFQIPEPQPNRGRQLFIDFVFRCVA